MKLATSMGDFWRYVSTVPEAISSFKNSKFRNINLELATNTPAFYSDNEKDWKTFVKQLVDAREEAGVQYVVYLMHHFQHYLPKCVHIIQRKMRLKESKI